jgi:streptomycin 6-kinase
LLHGDLHHDSILQNGDEWIVIDPKGVIGEPAYEVAAFIRNPIPDLLQIENQIEIIKDRINCFSTLLELPHQRIIDWCFVQGVLAWVWALEDGCDASYFEDFINLMLNQNLVRLHA